MRIKSGFFIILILTVFFLVGFIRIQNVNSYQKNYFKNLEKFNAEQQNLLHTIAQANLNTEYGIEIIKEQIHTTRLSLKNIDFWFRYLNPVAYHKINGPLPVEWETEVFEKYEKPYKRMGAGLTLAELYLGEDNIRKDSLLALINSSVQEATSYSADSVTKNLQSNATFFLCNRLYLLNLAAIYTTGFECPDTSRVIPELQVMMGAISQTYQFYNESYPDQPLSAGYISLYKSAIDFVNKQPWQYSLFDHYHFIRNYINPLFSLNQQFIINFKAGSRSVMDYSLNKFATSIFTKELYNGQNIKGIFSRVQDKDALDSLNKAGKFLFYDPILSGNLQRSCASCHKSTEYFTDTSASTSLAFDGVNHLERNTPSLVNANFNHLLMLDGKHISLQNQGKAVITNPTELGSSEDEVMQRVLSCADYKKTFDYLLQFTPAETEINFNHIVSALSFYYSKFSVYYSPFDDAMNKKEDADESVKRGFNLFMSKAQCATCHFLPQFNGVKPPYVSSEFEVLGVPGDTNFKSMDTDKGRYMVNPVDEMLDAFRTGSLRNASHTGPYMHNGIFKTLEQVIDFYDAGGGAGKGLAVTNQTLSSDSLHLTKAEKNDLIHFILSLDEKIPFELPPANLPQSNNAALNKRIVGGTY